MEPLDRRGFMKSVAGTAALAAGDLSAAAAEASGAVFLATWPFGKNAIDRAAEVFHGGGSLLDAVEKGINVVEDDPAVMSVGYGGLPNAEGVVSLDAAIMDGTRHRAGSVCNLHMIKNPISVARQVIERTRHTTMAGDGAFQFAVKIGFKPEQLLTPASLKRWLDWKANPNRQTFWLKPGENHDTIGVVATDGNGRIVAGCSTSGLAWKLPGRVADSSLVGCGIYAEDGAGGASATGDGDIMTNYCTSISIVRMMSRGDSPQEACEQILREMAKADPRNRAAQAAVIGMNARGETGAACMNPQFHLRYALWKDGTSQMLDAKVMYE